MSWVSLDWYISDPFREMLQISSDMSICQYRVVAFSPPPVKLPSHVQSSSWDMLMLSISPSPSSSQPLVDDSSEEKTVL